MDVPDSTGKTVRQQLEFVQEKSGVRPELLDEEVEISTNESQFLTLFWKVYGTRSNPFGSLTLSDINIWCQVFDFKLASIELDYMMELGQMVTGELSKQQKG